MNEAISNLTNQVMKNVKKRQEEFHELAGKIHRDGYFAGQKSTEIDILELKSIFKELEEDYRNANENGYHDSANEIARCLDKLRPILGNENES